MTKKYKKLALKLALLAAKEQCPVDPHFVMMIQAESLVIERPVVTAEMQDFAASFAQNHERAEVIKLLTKLSN